MGWVRLTKVFEIHIHRLQWFALCSSQSENSSYFSVQIPHYLNLPMPQLHSTAHLTALTTIQGWLPLLLGPSKLTDWDGHKVAQLVGPVQRLSMDGQKQLESWGYHPRNVGFLKMLNSSVYTNLHKLMYFKWQQYCIMSFKYRLKYMIPPKLSLNYIVFVIPKD